MNQNEFEKLLGAEPRSRDPEFLAHKHNSVENADRVRDALAFEDKLEAALKLPVDDGLADRILAHVLPEQTASSTPSENEFEQMLGAEPRSQDPEFLALTNRSAENASKAQEALVFEDKLDAALTLPVDDGLADRILAAVLPEQSEATPSENQFDLLLGAEPRSRDPEFRALKNSSIENAGKARDALAFEDKLEAALKLPADDGFADQILAQVLPEQPASVRAASQAAWTKWFPIAASVALIFGAGVYLGRSSNNIEDIARLQAAFAEHVTHERYALELTKALDNDQVKAAFASHGASWEPQPGHYVTYMAKCVIGDKTGIHLVMVSETGERTSMMYLPDESVDSAKFAAGELPARMFGTGDGGVAAVFAHGDQDLDNFDSTLL